jgi:HEAT repeat protein
VDAPSGKYELHASVDLGHLFGVIEHQATIEIVQPGPAALDERLKQLESEDPNVRRTALIDLRYFKKDADRVVPAVVGRLDDEDANVRMIAMSVLISYPKGAAEHHEKILEILECAEAISVRSMAVQLLARSAPSSDAVEAALVKALEKTDDRYRRLFESQLQRYRQRTGRAQPK